MKRYLLSLLILSVLSNNHSAAQSLAINTDGSTANASALLDVKSTQKGMLVPRMSRTERNAIASPATGLLIYQNGPDSIGFHYYDGTRWSPVISHSNSDLLAWRTGGNTGTIDGSHYIGTTDNVPLNIKVNNQKAGRIASTGETFLGYQAGNVSASGANTGIGAQALLSNSTGINNTSVGFAALRDNTIGSNNTAIGYAALLSNTTGNENLALGTDALRSNISGTKNTALSGGSLYSNSSGNENIAIGYFSLFSNSTGSQNVAIGDESSVFNTTGNGNTALGFHSLYSNGTGYSNVAIGLHALASNTISSNLVAVGDSALYTNTGTDNTAVGSKALYSNTTGNGNTSLGKSSLYSNTTGNNNMAAGFSALSSNTTGYNNTAAGMDAMKANTTGYNNTATGVQALTANTSGTFNTATGVAALSSNTTGYNNTAMGMQALNSNIDGFFNTATGLAALFYNTSGSSNTATGMDALRLNTTGSQNTAIGMRALNSNTTGINNTATGVNALYANTEGIFNTATGVNALTTNTTGNNNTAFGQQALNSNVTGSNNTALGLQAGFLATGSGNVFLGLQAGYNETGNNKLYIANNSNNPPIIYGDFSTKTLGFGTITPNSTYGFAKVEIASEGFGAPTDLLIRNAATSSGYAPGLVFQHARGTLAAPVTVNNGDYLAAISTMNYDGSNYILSAGLDIFADGAIAAGIVPTRLQFNTMNTAGSYAARLTIKNDGKIGIATTGPAATLDVNGNFKLGTAGNSHNALLRSTVNIDLPSIAANSESDITVTVTGASTTASSVFVSPAADIESGLVIAWARVSAANTVKIRFRNETGSAIDPAAVNYVVSVLQ
ncbi:MAG: hypothetical protein U0T79_08825 [Ferruginibacter sp.]